MIFIVMTVLLTVVVGGLLFAARAGQYPEIARIQSYLDIQNGLLLEPTVFYDRSGEIPLYRLAPPEVERDFLAYEDFSPQLVNVAIAVNDPDYWNTFGYDQDSIPVTLISRLLTPLASDDVLMRYWLVSSLLYSEGKQQVLAWYLNSSHYGQQTVGVEQAAQLYLGKSAADLSLAEAALLTAVQQTPALNPFDALSAALENKDRLLNDLLTQGYISEAEYQSAMAEILLIEPSITAEEPPSLVQRAIDAISQEIPTEQLLLGGYRIITTMDVDLQRQSECVIQEQLNRINDPDFEIDPMVLDNCPAARFLAVLPPSETPLDYSAVGSTVLLDPRTSQVLALVEQPDLQPERIRLPQQPGTSLAPFVALTGFSVGESPATLRWDIPGDDPVEFTPYLQEEQFYQGPLRTREAIIEQDALVLAEWMADLGETEVIRFAQTAGLPSLAANNTAQLLFTGSDLSLAEQAHAHGVFANLGIQYGVQIGEDSQPAPQVVLNVFAPGNELMLLNCTTVQSQVLVGSDLSYLVHDVLSDEVLRRGAYGYPNSLSIGRPVGGLFSFSDFGQQRWTLGYTPQLVGGVWLGSDTGNPLPERGAGNVWYALMTYALQGKPVEGWEKPENILTMTVCSPSGLLPTTACQQLVTETFIEGNEPVQLDNLYQSFAINRETGRLATIFTPLPLVDERIFLVVPPEAQQWAAANGLPVPPSDYDTIQQVPFSPDANLTAPVNFSTVGGEITIRGTAAGEGFVAYTLQVGEGLNPDRWIEIQEESAQPVNSGILGVWDTTGYEGLFVVRLVIEREGQQLESTLLQVTVDNTLPEVTVLSPQPDEALTQNEAGEVVFQVQPADNLGIAEVRWWVDGMLVASRELAPYTAFVAFAPGEYSLSVEVIDQAGNTTLSDPRSFTVLD